MDVIHDATACDRHYPELVLTIGSFDGVHLGHRAILDTVIARARERGGKAGVMSLQPHPRVFFGGEDFPLLSDGQQKIDLLEAAGVDVYFILPFNEQVARMEAGVFLERVILERCGARHLVVGDDFAFGAGARGNYDFLALEGRALGLTAEMLSPVLSGEARVSSTRIRNLVAAGEMEEAAGLLGRPYAVAGTVARGRGLGRQLGFPTANVLHHGILLPAHGIYIGEVNLDGRRYAAAVNIGYAPTLPHEQPIVEAHLLDFEGDLAGRRIEVQLHRWLRGEKRFGSIAELKQAIEMDIVEVRHYFKLGCPT